MDIRHVVTTFLLHPDGERILAGRRSDNVRTYPGRWAGISGAVETNEEPLQAALREVAEETRLEPTQDDVLSTGHPVRLVDWDYGCVWIIHPFIIACTDPDAVCRDWEHVELRWLSPDELWTRDTVPKLREAWKSAQAGTRDIDAVFKRIREDREHGAEELGIWTLEALAAARREGRDLQSLCRRALDLRPSMATVRSAALAAWEQAREAAPGDAIEHRRRDTLLAAAQAGEALPRGGHVVTLSRSFTVLATLYEARERVARLTVAESRPDCEGRSTAALAASFGIEVVLATDAAACATVRDADVVIFGADAVTGTGDVVNKVGTLALCAAAQHFNVPTIAVATPSKILPTGTGPRMEYGSPDALGNPLDGVTVRNPLFEIVPAGLVGRIVMPDGPVGSDELSEQADHLAALQAEVLG